MQQILHRRLQRTGKGKIWTKVIKIWANLVRFGQNQATALGKFYYSQAKLLNGAMLNRHLNLSLLNRYRFTAKKTF